MLSLLLQEGHAGKGSTAAASVGNSYVINLAKTAGIKDVRDAAFLYGYTEPVLLLLHETEPTWPGRYYSLASLQATVTCLVTISA